MCKISRAGHVEMQEEEKNFISQREVVDKKNELCTSAHEQLIGSLLREAKSDPAMFGPDQVSSCLPAFNFI